MSVTDVSPRSHIDTPAWQSFEARMRVRAAERRAAKRRRRLQYAGLSLVGLLGAATGWFAVASLPYLDRLIDIRTPPPVALPRPIASAPAEPLPIPASVAMLGNQIFEPPTGGEPAPERVAPSIGTSAPAEPPGTVATSARVDLPASRTRAADARTRAEESPSRAAAAPRLETAGPRAATAPESTGGLRTPQPEPESATAVAERPALPPAPAPSSNGGQEQTERTIEKPVQPVAPPPARGEPIAVAADIPEPAALSTPSYAASTPVAPAVDVSSVRAAVRGTIERYRTAYERLDAAAARAVWPGVDAAALSRAFGSIESQRLSFEDCAIDVAAGGANATCTGRASIVPKIGGGSQTVRRTWQFRLAQNGDAWTIASATVR
jgi:hypothetical protein